MLGQLASNSGVELLQALFPASLSCHLASLELVQGGLRHATLVFNGLDLSAQFVETLLAILDRFIAALVEQI